GGDARHQREGCRAEGAQVTRRAAVPALLLMFAAYLAALASESRVWIAQKGSEIAARARARAAAGQSTATISAVADGAFDGVDLVESAGAGGGCRSWLCRERGPCVVRTMEAAETLAQEHRRKRFLGLFRHDAFAYDLSPEQKAAGAKLAAFLRTGQLPPQAP